MAPAVASANSCDAGSSTTRTPARLA